MQRLIYNNAAFLCVMTPTAFLITETLALKKYIVINRKQFKNGRMRQNKFILFSEAICHLENIVTSMFV